MKPSIERRLVTVAGRRIWRTLVADESGGGPSGPVTAADIDSTPGTNGEVLTADGAGGASWEPGGGSVPISSPLDLPGCALWLDASQLALADDDPVATWPDLSPSGYDATQTDPDLKPVYKAAVQNGLGVVRFASSPDVQRLGLTGDGLDLAREVEAVTLAVAIANPVDTAYFTANAGGVDPTIPRFYAAMTFVTGGANTDHGGTNDDAGGSAAQGDTVSSPGSQVFVFAFSYTQGTFVADSSSGTAWVGPASDLTPGPTPDTPSARVNVGANYDESGGSNCDFCEVAVYPRLLNAAERRQLLEYLSAKWSL